MSAPLGYRAVLAPPHPTRPQRARRPATPAPAPSPGPGSGTTRRQLTPFHDPPERGRKDPPPRSGRTRRGAPAPTRRRDLPRDTGTAAGPVEITRRDHPRRTFPGKREGIFGKRPFGWRLMGFSLRKSSIRRECEGLAELITLFGGGRS
ncbi:hypothetical protein San01_39880 [Streptomyces angustmyceticus]|uniref:Uncharacterized protein n=1 Tax=Streptomyces angustmyceticus TaxID=285578 RepID=A0A5J4LHX8_9ACTN|nr:hypothetical protein San01_39880 [Streptomyces angustmyceticus]